MIEGLRQRLSGWNPKVILAVVLVALASFALGGLVFRSRAPSEHATGPAATGAEATTWTCAMHPQIRQPEPGQCPICGMDLIPVESQGGAEAQPERIVLSERGGGRGRSRARQVPVASPNQPREADG
jgi:membrane fusion protein, copper/silver efflux system